MILRRLAGHFRHDNWFTVILELVVVVVGLFLAFQLDRWYESQRTKSDQQAHLEALTEDFTENETRLILAISEGKPGRSVRTKRMPLLASAGLMLRVACSALCTPTPITDTALMMVFCFIMAELPGCDKAAAAIAP